MITHVPAGLMSVDHYISLLARLIEDNEPALVAARADRLVFCNNFALKITAYFLD